MQTANAAKIGVWIVIALAIIIFGTRYFQGLALGGSNTIIADFERVDGLIAGNPVQMRGVRIGAVTSITIDADRAMVEVRMSINRTIPIREGAEARLSGIPALGDMRIEIEPGPLDLPAVPSGGRIKAATPIDLVKMAENAAGGYMETVEEILQRTNEAIESLNRSLSQDGDVKGTLEALRNMSTTLDNLLEEEAEHLANTIRNFESVSANLDTLTSLTADSAGAMASLTRSLDQLELTLVQTRSLTGNLDTLLTKVNAGEGTLGLLANDPSLYQHMDSVAVNLSRLLEDLRRDPKRYLRHVKAVEIF